MSQKNASKMCKSPKNTAFNKHEKIEYDLSTNCTVVGSNNLNLVKKPQNIINMSPVYSNPSPSYPQSPYSSPASLKSPSPSLKPPTPQPNFPVMQIIHNNHPLLARQIQTSQPQNIIKLKPHLNILPKPSASPQPSPKPSVSPQIVIPNHQQATIMPTAQPLLLNQMPTMLTGPGVQFILRPQTATKIQPQMPAAATATPQGLILQQSGQQLLHIPRSQPMVRVLTNGMQLAPSTTTYVTHMANQQPITAAQISQQIVNNVHQHQQPQPIKKKPKQKPKKKLDLANIMKLSGIGDDDDIQFESDASQSESEHNSVPGTPQPLQLQQQQHQNLLQQAAVQQNLAESKKQQQQQHQQQQQLGNIQISAMPLSAPVVQVLNQNFQSGMISNSTSQTQTGIPFNSFIAPNFTINNGLMLQRSSGGFKLTMGEDGRLVLQHDPQLQTQDLQSQLILQSLLGLNGGLVLQPSMDQQTIQQQTVQTIQQQSVQTIQQQTIQTVQQQIQQPQIQNLQQQTVQQTIQHQTVSQPLMQQIVQPMHGLQNHLQNLMNQQQQQQQHIQQQQSSPAHTPTHTPIQSFQQTQTQTQPILKVQPFQKSQPPVQTVHPQPIQQQTLPPPPPQEASPTSYVVNLTPDQLEQLKRNGQVTVNGQTIFMQRPNKCNDAEKKLSPKSKPIKKANKIHAVKNFLNDEPPKPLPEPPKEKVLCPAPKPQNPPQMLVPPQNSKPSIQTTKNKSKKIESNGENVDKLFNQILEENHHHQQEIKPQPNKPPPITTIELTPQKQQHLRSIQVQIQTLNNRMQPGDLEMQNALKLLFNEQQKILASGKLLPPDKVYYHNNQLTIVNPNVNPLPSPGQIKSEPRSPQPQPATCAVAGNNVARSVEGVKTPVSVPQIVSNAAHPVPRIAVPPSEIAPTQPATPRPAVINHLPPPSLPTVLPHPPPAHAPVNQAPPAPQPQQQPATPHVVNNNHNHLLPRLPAPAPPAPQHSATAQQQQQQTAHSLAKKAHLIEKQLAMDQNGATNPDLNTPFRDKKDACVRLIRYHCMEQPVLSEKDLDKADEIFEVTAKHFIGKYSKMVDKYKFLLMKESMRQVPTSELMMLDRMFLADEQQSLMRMRSDLEQQLVATPPEAAPPANHAHAQTSQEVYDEWACIQRELAGLPHHQQQQHAQQSETGVKRTFSSTDSRLETLKKFRVEKNRQRAAVSMTCDSANHSFSSHDDNEPENNSIDEQVQSAIDSILNLQQSTTTSAAPLDLDSILS
ncbi:unnamed protein product [Brassicogethes aeneus]|uniref:GLTSCR protein conserved domain-containing protein n=1 Tax=Brassicogethes aeneus TaxID=1431903 RepID=A0A9P0AUG5_BRAAE|nr:unnamed protein product [Brassicogethes aeneus]